MRKGFLFLPFLLLGCAQSPVSSSESSLEESSSSSLESSVPVEVPEKIYLYDEGNVPYDGEESAREYAFLTPYLSSSPTGGAVIVVPGGGYTHLSNSTPDEGKKNGGKNNDGNQKEASAIAPIYNEAGISVFVLNYRTTYVDPSLDYRALLSDIQRATRIVRMYAKDFSYSEDRLALQGYSAGGHLCLMEYEQASWTIDDEGYRKDEIDELSCLPNALVLGYPVVSLLDGQTHASTRKVFTGNDPSLYSAFSAELHVKEEFPSTYLFHEKNDPTVPAKGSELLAEAMDFFEVDHHFDLFQDEAGGDIALHGFGVVQDLPEASVWTNHALSFLKERGF